MKYFLFALLTCLLTNCAEPAAPESPAPVATTAAARAVLEAHLSAVERKDLAALHATLSPNGEMRLILPGAEVQESVDSFLAFHEEWFADTTWSMETRIVDLYSGPELGYAITELLYREPERDGRPYFNRMQVSYVLRRIGDDWYVVQDHASSTEKSTD